MRAAIAASTVSGVEIAYSGRWCSPRAIASTPSSSAQHGFVDDLPDRGSVRHERTGVVLGDVAEAVEAEQKVAHALLQNRKVIDTSTIRHMIDVSITWTR